MIYAVIIAGGVGKRLWPKSRKDYPKFLFRLNGRRSLLQETVGRVSKLLPMNNILVITSRDYLRLIRKELPGLPRNNIIAEPVSRNTAPAVCIAASLVKKKNPNGVIFVMPADQIIEDKAAIKEALALGSLVAHIKKAIVTIGIKPTFPATGYGYIKVGRLYKSLRAKRDWYCYKVDRLIEKPPLKKAKVLLRSKRYLWNGGIFIGRAQTFLDELKRYKPSICRVAEKIEKGLGTRKQQALIDRNYRKFPEISIDYAIMEKTKIAYVVKADISWQDIGSWASIENYLAKGLKGNILIGTHFTLDLNNSIILGEKDHLVAALGLDNIIVVHTRDATLVCARDRAEDVKKLVELAEKKGLKRYL